MPRSNPRLPAHVLLSQSVSEACKLTDPCVPRCAQRCDPASLMHPFNSFSGSAVSVAIPPWRFARRVCEVATEALACLVWHGSPCDCACEAVMRPTLTICGRVWPLAEVSWYHRARLRVLDRPVGPYIIIQIMRTAMQTDKGCFPQPHCESPCRVIRSDRSRCTRRFVARFSVLTSL